MQLKIVFHIVAAVVSAFHIDGLRAQPSEQARISDTSIGFAAAIVKDHRMVDQSIVYAYSGDQGNPGLLFIHGTPGGWDAFETYLASPSLTTRIFYGVS
jgi:hypothetical protein